MPGAEQRIDKWLFFARVCKSRSLAQKLTLSGAVRINKEKTTSAAKLVRPGDVLTVTLGAGVKVLRILDPGERRGPAVEAQTLYEDLTPPPVKPETAAEAAAAIGYQPSDRPPTKHERRALDRMRWNESD